MCRAPSPNRARIVERLDRREHPVQVEQRLAHAHEHDVRQALPVGREAARGVTDLVDDLGGLEVAPEPELAGGAERAADRAAGLARDAQRVPLAAAGRGPGSASAPTRSSAPSSRRWSAFSVRPPSARRISVSADGVEAERRARAPARSAAGSVRIVGRVGRRRRPPDGIGDLAGAVRRLARASTHARSSSGGRPDRPGEDRRASGLPAIELAAGMLAARTSGLPGRPAAWHEDRPPRTSPLIGRPPAGWTSRAASRRRPSRRSDRPPIRTCRPPGCVSAVATGPGAPTRRGARRRSRRTMPGHGWYARTWRSSSTAPARIESAVLAAERPGQRRALVGCGARVSSPRSHGSRSGQQVGGDHARRASRTGRGLVPSSVDALLGDDRSGVEARVHAHQASPRSQDRRRGSRPGSGVAPRCRGSSDGCRFSAPWGTSSSVGRHDLAVVGEDDELRLELEDRRDRRRVTEPLGRQDRVEAELAGGRPRSGSACTSCARPTGLGGAVTTPTRSTSGCVDQSLQDRVAERRRCPRKTVRTRPGRRRHARALVASRTSASSSSLSPTGISSSIDSR